MSEIFKIIKGLNINLEGGAEKIFVQAAKAESYAVKPADFKGVQPKLAVKEGDPVKAGSVLFYDKANPEVKFTSPVSGTVQVINRGERRKVLEVVVAADAEMSCERFVQASPSGLSREEIIGNIQNSGLWPSIRQRPYNRIAKSTDTPKSIFISAFDTAPLAPDYNFILEGLGQEFQAGIDALAKLCGTIHLNINSSVPASAVFTQAKGVTVNRFNGPHPAGNVGTQIHAIA